MLKIFFNICQNEKISMNNKNYAIELLFEDTRAQSVSLEHVDTE